MQTPGTRSLGGYWGDTDSRDVEDVTLKVHGISPAGKFLLLFVLVCIMY